MKGIDAFRARMVALLGDEADAFFCALHAPASRSFRFDPTKVTQEELRLAFGDALGERIPFFEHAYRFTADSIGNHPFHHGGALYVQEPAAMAPVAALGNRRFHRILDLCAAPGGKSLQAATLLAEDGVIICNEPDPKRRRILMQNLERMGLISCQVTGFDAREIPEEWNGSFDLVICDAPCSGEGMVRKSPEVAEEWSEENVRTSAARQKEILTRAARLVSPHGILLYSTCAWSREENEERVAAFLKENEDFSLASPASSVAKVSLGGIPVEGMELPWEFCRRFYPHIFQGEGQFLALMERGDGDLDSCLKRKEKRKAKKSLPNQNEKEALSQARAFLEQVLEGDCTMGLWCRGEEVYLIPAGGVPPEQTVSPGVLLGEYRKGRIVPHHRFFLAFAHLFKKKIVLTPDDPRVEAYLRGEELSLPQLRGFAVLFYLSCPLGGVKCDGTRGKNYYPKGLRKS